MTFRCPHCKQPLLGRGNALACANAHSFDRAKSGYVNLLPPRGGGNHGDNRGMIRARHTFLSRGHYRPLADLLCETAVRYAQPNARVLDAGCGECYYTARLCRALSGAGFCAQVCGVDISRDALILGGRDPALQLAVASVYDLPLADAACDLLLSVFAPFCADEFWRVLTPGGRLLQVFPLERHLFGLKRAIYDTPYLNEPHSDALDGFALLERRELCYTIMLTEREDIKNLFLMTPYYYKTSSEDQKKLETLEILETELAFGLLVYEKTISDAN